LEQQQQQQQQCRDFDTRGFRRTRTFLKMSISDVRKMTQKLTRRKVFDKKEERRYAAPTTADVKEEQR